MKSLKTNDVNKNLFTQGFMALAFLNQKLRYGIGRAFLPSPHLETIPKKSIKNRDDTSAYCTCINVLLHNMIIKFNPPHLILLVSSEIFFFAQ